MKTLTYKQIADCVRKLTKACAEVTPSCAAAMREARSKETNENACFALDMLLENAEVARKRGLPVCQDTGMAVVFAELGQDVHIEGGLLTDAIDEGVRRGYGENGFRASVLDPINRVNTGDNTPAVTHISIVDGDSLKLTFLPKGFGSENMSKLYMLTPSAGLEGVKRCVVEAVEASELKGKVSIMIGGAPVTQSYWKRRC